MYTSDLKFSLSNKGWGMIETSSLDELMGIAHSLGRPIPSRRGSPIVDVLTPKSPDEAHPASMSAFYGTTSFPFHTDGSNLHIPPRYVMLRAEMCLHDYPTLLCNLNFLWGNAKWLQDLKRCVWIVKGGRGKFYTSILSDIGGKLLLRYDPCCMKPALNSFRVAGDILEKAIQSSDIEQVYWKNGLTVVIDNWRVMHGRPDVTDCKDIRILQRVFVE